jgi:SPP1 gp7 family putative phage head morphogenesis protein
MDYRIYDQMRLDDQVSVCLQMKKDLVLGAGFSFHTKDVNQKIIVDDLTRAFDEDVLTPFDEQLEEMLTAYEYGHSCSEKIFRLRPDNSLTFSELKTRQPNTWLYETDDKGNVISYKQRGMAGNGDIVINPNAILHYVNKRRFQNPYGESDLRPAYQAWFTKIEITKYFAIFLEKAASPIPIGKYNPSVSKQIKEELLSILKKFQTKTALVVPKDMDVDFLETKNNGEVYRAAINIFNMFIGRCLFVPDLLGFQGDETSGGSYSLGKEQMRIFFMHLARRRKYCEKIINKHLVFPICVYNHGVSDTYPKFKFNPITEEAVYDAIKLWTEIVKTNSFKPTDDEINYVRNLLNFPEGEVIRPTPIQAVPNGLPNVPSTDANSVSTDSELPTESIQQVDKNYSKNSYPNDYYKKVDFKKIENSLDTFLNSTMDDLKPVAKYVINDLCDQIEKKKIISNQRIDRIEDISLKRLKDIKIILKNAFREQYQDAKKMAQNELFKVNYALPLPTDAFLKFLEEETYSYVGDWSYNITKNAKQEMINAIKDGKPLSDVVDMLTDQGLKDSLVSMERYARTKFTEVMNRGRLDYFESSKIVQGYQYSAILDDSTTDICESLDGKVFKDGEQPIPPLHFNCRSLLVPITIYEEVDKWNTVPNWITDKVENMKFSVQ